MNSGKYIANFATVGKKALLVSDPLWKLTPTISEFKVSAMDTGTYAASGSVVTRTKDDQCDGTFNSIDSGDAWERE